MMTQICNNDKNILDKGILVDLLERADIFYSCNRGPRPSGALLYTADGRYIYGDVTPTSGSHPCKDVGCMIEDGHCVRNVHAEVDAIVAAARLGVATAYGIMYSVNKPCFNCTKAIIKAGIKTVVYAYAVYDEKRTNIILKAAGVECIHVPI